MIPFSRAAIRREVGAYLVLAWPIVLAQLSFIGMGVADTMLAGRLGAASLAAVAVGANVFFLFFVFFSGLFMAVSALVAQARGAGRTIGEIAAIHRGALQLAWGAGLLWTLLMIVVREPLLEVLQLDAQTRALADGYLRAIVFAPLPFCLSFVQRNVADAHGLTRLSLMAGVIALAANVFAAWVLMFGRFGVPAQGPAGAGYATAIGGVVLSLSYAALYRATPVLRAVLRAVALRELAAPARRETLRVGLPIAAILSAEASLFQIGGLLVARFGAEAMAAHQIALNFASVTFMIPLSIGLAATVRVGLAAGAGDAAAVALRGRVGMLLGILFTMASASLMAFAPEAIVALYMDPNGDTNGDADSNGVARLAILLLGFAAAFQIFDGVQATANGALRGIKDTRLPMLITIAAYWIVGLPLALGLAFTAGWGPAGIWAGFIGGLVVAAIGLSTRFVLLSRPRSSRHGGAN